jgi:hypothetical protein
VLKYLNTNTSYTWMDGFCGTGHCRRRSQEWKIPTVWYIAFAFVIFIVAFPRTVSTRTTKWSTAIASFLPTQK